MQNTPKGMRIHIGIFGKRNVGKSSILNALTKQDISIVSATAGTTTDPVEKSMELLPLGPVLFVDTAGIDDEGALGLQRVEKTKKVIDRIDLAIIVCDSRGLDNFEEKLVRGINKKIGLAAQNENYEEVNNQRSLLFEELKKIVENAKPVTIKKMKSNVAREESEIKAAKRKTMKNLFA